MLEKKWTSVLRLQKKVLELEAKVHQMEEAAKLGNVISRRDVVGAHRSACLPRAPRKFELSGHRSPITVRALSTRVAVIDVFFLQCVVFHPVFSVIVSGSEDAALKVWDFEIGEYERTLKGHTNSVQSAAFNTTGTLLASTASDLTIKLWNFAAEGNYECIRTLRGHDHNVSCVIFDTIQSERIFTCSRDQHIKLWDISTGYCTKTLLNGHTDWIRDIALTDDSQVLASCGNDKSIVIWDLQTFRPIQTIREHEHVIESITFSRNVVEHRGTEKAVSRKSGLAGFANSPAAMLNLADSKSGGAGENGMHLDHAEVAKKLRYLLSGSRDRTVRLWEALSGVLLMNFTQHENWVRMVRFHPSGKYVISAAEDKSVRVFDIEASVECSY